MLAGCFLNKYSLSYWFLILFLHIWLVMSPIKLHSNFSYNRNNNTTSSDQIKPPQGVVSLTSWLKCSSFWTANNDLDLLSFAYKPWSSFFKNRTKKGKEKKSLTLKMFYIERLAKTKYSNFRVAFLYFIHSLNKH